MKLSKFFVAVAVPVIIFLPGCEVILSAGASVAASEGIKWVLASADLSPNTADAEYRLMDRVSADEFPGCSRAQTLAFKKRGFQGGIECRPHVGQAKKLFQSAEATK